ncbi:MAG: O-antigen ligase family protein [Pseudomonadota bacterium]
MLGSIKALFIVLCLALPVFWLAKPACLHFMSDEDFRRRRVIWAVSTCAVFLSPHILIFFLIVVPTTMWAVKKDSNPLAMLGIVGSTVPYATLDVPHLFPLTLSRILVFCIVIPLLLRSEPALPRAAPAPRQHANWIVSFLLFAFLTLLIIPKLQSYSWSEVLRQEILMILDTMVPFWFLLRMLRSFKTLNEVLAVTVLTSAVMAPVALFESLWGWLLYSEVTQNWGAGGNPFAYVMRGDRVRALVTTDHSLALGFMMAIAFGYWLHLQRWVPSRSTTLIGAALMWVGMIAAYSRGPWIAAILLMFAYFGLMPKGTGRVIKALVLGGLLLAILAVTPFGAGIIDTLPFVGHMDSENVDYRAQLFSLAMELIPQHPWFGDLNVTSHMESLRQGQGIIDLVNGFLLIALFYGLVPLAILVLIIFIVLGKIRFAAVRSRQYDINVYSLGAVLIACILAALFFTWVARFAWELISLFAMGLAYARLVNAATSSAAPAVMEAETGHARRPIRKTRREN